MKKQFISPIISIFAMLLLIASRFASGEGFDWLAIAASVLILIGIISIVIEYKKLK